MSLKPKSNKALWKAVMLNAHFLRCFNYSVPPLAHHSYHISSSDEISDLLCSEEEVEYLLSSGDTSKATGPDGISARMLKSTAARA